MLRSIPLLVFFLVLLVGVPQGVAQIPPDRLIVPGSRVGDYLLVMRLPQILEIAKSKVPNYDRFFGDKILTRPCTEVDCRDGMLEALIPGVAVGTNDVRSGTVLYLAPSSPDFKTSRGVALGSSVDDVLVAYGPPTATTDAGRLVYGTGIAFLPDASRHIRSLQVFYPTFSRRIWKF